MKKQVVVIHGGDTFDNYDEYLSFLRDFKIDIERYSSEKSDWKPWLRRALGEGYEVILPVMPNKTNAQYKEWKIWFEKLTPFIGNNVVLVGHSLGGIFLAKYLSENEFSKKIKAVILVAPVFDKDEEGYGVATFSLPEKLDLKTDKIIIYHSKDDPVVSISSLEKYVEKLPQAERKIFKDGGHFTQEEFPELVQDILALE